MSHKLDPGIQANYSSFMSRSLETPLAPVELTHLCFTFALELMQPIEEMQCNLCVGEVVSNVATGVLLVNSIFKEVTFGRRSTSFGLAFRSLQILMRRRSHCNGHVSSQRISFTN